MKSHSLKYLRMVVAVLCLVAAMVLFADFTGYAAAHWGWLAKIQLVPAVLALNLGALVFLVVLTLVFGRLYCSVICPLGILQDVLAWLRRITGSKMKKRLGFYRYTPAGSVWRYVFLGIFALLVLCSAIALLPMSYAGILDPYSSFGRMAGQGIVPLWRVTADAIASWQADKGVYLFEAVPSPAVMLSLGVGVVAIVSFVTVFVFAVRTGRGYCNTVCPVGTILGFVSRFSLLKPVIDTDKCTRCGSCGRHCKARCIDTKNHKIDYSRCVVCFDCINSCKEGAISYRLRRSADAAKTPATPAPAPSAGRRAFLAGTAIVAGAAVASASDKLTDGGLAPLKDKKRRRSAKAAVPPGAVSLRHFRSHCTACQLCVSRCPNEVLRPSTSLDGFMQPVMVFTSGFCRPECTACGEVCPTGAILPVDAAAKSAIKVGTAVVDATLCISAAYGQTCGNCARHCPAGAIIMVRGDNGNMRPTVDAARCIGCGACEYHCPSGTAGQLSASRAAIYVDGIEEHQTV